MNEWFLYATSMQLSTVRDKHSYLFKLVLYYSGHQITKEESKRRKKEQKRTTKTTGKQKQHGNGYINIKNTLNINGLNVPIKRHREVECIKIMTDMLPRRNSL